MSRKKALVTGGCGFIGSNLVDFLVEKEFEVIVLDNLSTGREANIRPSKHVTLIRHDLLDEISAEALRGCGILFHFAANADIRDGMKHSQKDIEQNIVATERVARLAVQIGIRDIVFASTAAVLGEPNIFPTPEDVPNPRQTSLYGMSKMAAEGVFSVYSLNHDLRVSVFRFVSIVGPRYSHGHIIDFVRKLEACQNELEILGDGNQRKSYLHVNDLLRAVECVLARHQEDYDPFFEIYNVGNDEYCTVTESASLICDAIGVKPKFSYTGGARGWVGDSPFVHLDTAKLKALGWRPRIDIRQAIRSTAVWLKEEMPKNG